MISAAFYAEAGAGKEVAVGAGMPEAASLRLAQFRPGRLLAVVHVRYVEEAKSTPVVGARR